MNIRIYVLLFIAVIVLSACESKTEKTIPENQKTEITQGETNPVKNKKNLIPDIKGTYWGKFDKRQTVLDISKQTDSSFSGKITINYEEIINQGVKGSFSPAAKKISMEDQLSSRYKGKYDGKLSNDYNNISGIFTMYVDGRQFTFNLTKK